jgi:hypothetical protein
MSGLEHMRSSLDSERTNQMNFLIESYVEDSSDKATKETFLALAKTLSESELRQTQDKIDRLFRSETDNQTRRDLLELKAGLINIQQDRVSKLAVTNKDQTIGTVPFATQEVIEKSPSCCTLVDATCSLKQITLSGKFFKDPKIKTREIDNVPMDDFESLGVDEEGYARYVLIFDGRKIPLGVKIVGNVFSVDYQGSMYTTSLTPSSGGRSFDGRGRKDTERHEERSSDRDHFEVRNGRGMRVTTVERNIQTETIEYMKIVEFHDRDFRVKFEVSPR